MVVDAGNWFRNDIIFVGIFVMGFTGLFIDWLLKFLEKKLVPWSGQGLIKIDDRSKKQGLKKGENIMRVKRLVSLHWQVCLRRLLH